MFGALAVPDYQICRINERRQSLKIAVIARIAKIPLKIESEGNQRFAVHYSVIYCVFLDFGSDGKK